MKRILAILDGVEQGVQISLEDDTIYSIGTQDDSDFYIRKNKFDFLVYFNLVGDIIECWSTQKINATQDENEIYIHLDKVKILPNTILEVGGRHFGVFFDDEALAEALVKCETLNLPEEGDEPPPDTAQEIEGVVAHSLPLDNDTTIEDSPLDNATANDQKRSSGSDDKLTLNPQSVTSDTSVVDAEVSLDREDTSKIFQLFKFAPFIIGTLILISFGAMYQISTLVTNNPLNLNPDIDEVFSAADKKSNDGDLALEKIDQTLAKKGVDAFLDNRVSADADADAGAGVEPQFIASGTSFNLKKNKTNRLQSPLVSRESQSDQSASENGASTDINFLYKTVDSGESEPMEAKEVLFPDEKMMSLINDMLDSAGAAGIDVRFNRGSYDVFGFVRDDSKWQRIRKILTSDLDLSKVHFSVETSITLLKKFKKLLKKFSLDEYVVLSLGSNGQIFAKTYYSPAQEGLWFTIKAKFENKYGDYVKIKEYRAHIGWINVVKVSFNHPAYVLLSDGRRLVEGSVWSGSSVLDKIFDDSIRVISGSSRSRYYMINKSRAFVNSGLSDS